ncbi:MAG: hypothetical protein JNK27_06330 [Chitinophagaceae bacterium]|nr:hypothetical protein [Chitinophagaceae bacterium]
MFLRITLPSIFVLIGLFTKGQQASSAVDSFTMYEDVKITIDKPVNSIESKETVIIFFALPNGNTTAQTMGKKMMPGDDWHFDIQHIRAQTRFVRQQIKNKNFVVIYLENNYKSWPSWKQKHPGFRTEIPHIIDSLSGLFGTKRRSIYLNGHSGGGSFIFGYLAGVSRIPSAVKRISFLDSDYGYDSSYYSKIKTWLQETKGANLNVFAYNDSIALYNGKPVVSATGGTWYRSMLLLKHLQNDFSITESRTDSLIINKSTDKRIQFYFKVNTDRGIYHTQQVELNGFIHSILCGTKYDSRRYRYYGTRAYQDLIE